MNYKTNYIKRVGIFGASGFAQEVADICLENRAQEIVFIDSKPTEKNFWGFPLVSESKVMQLKKDHFKFAIGIGSNIVRKEIYNRWKHLCEFPNIIHKSATFGYKQIDNINKKIGNIIAAGVRFTNNIVIGNFGIYNLNCTVGHDCIINDFINIAPGGNVSGNVLLEECSYIGSNAFIIQGKSADDKIYIGKNSIVGAGSVVLKSVSDNYVVAGNPAKFLKENLD